jgi:hypothetical protein
LKKKLKIAARTPPDSFFFFATKKNQFLLTFSLFPLFYWISLGLDFPPSKPPLILNSLPPSTSLIAPINSLPSLPLYLHRRREGFFLIDRETPPPKLGFTSLLTVKVVGRDEERISGAKNLGCSGNNVSWVKKGRNKETKKKNTRASMNRITTTSAK